MVLGAVIDAGQLAATEVLVEEVPPVAPEVDVLPPVLPLIALVLALEVPPVAALPPALVLFTAVDPPALDCAGAVVPPLSHATARSMEEPSTTMPSPVIRFSAIIRNLPKSSLTALPRLARPTAV